MRLIDIVRAHPRPLVAPLMGYPGARLTASTLRQNAFNAALHARSIEALVRRFEPDAVFFMMDLSIEAGALGLPVRYPLDASPTVEAHPVRCVDDLEAFRVLDPLEDVRIKGAVETMARMRETIRVPRGAYVVGPFTLAGLMMGATEIAVATLDDPALVHALLRLAEEVVTPYAQALVRAGADLVVLLEPTATFLSPAAFDVFSGAYLRRIVAQLDVPTVLHICGNTTRLVPAMCTTGVQGLSLDAPVDLAAAAAAVPAEVVLIGNVDPVRVMVEATPEGVRQAVRRLRAAMAPYPNFILSTGCDLPPETPLDHIDAFMEAGRDGAHL